MTPTPSPTPVPTAAPVVTALVRYSHYWPPLGGINTSQPEAPHLARCANGDRWQQWVGKGVACPPEWPLGMQIRAFGQTWTCVDRGGAIVWPWVDFLVPHAHLAHGEWLRVEIVEARSLSGNTSAGANSE